MRVNATLISGQVTEGRRTNWCCTDLLGGGLAPLTVAAGSVWLFLHGYADVFLGWGTRSGPVIAALLAFGTFVAMWKTRLIGNIAYGAGLVLCATLLEYLPITRSMWLIAGILCSAIGGVMLWHYARHVWVARVLASITVAYVESVFVFNWVYPDQLMVFFRGGWTT